MLDVSARLKRNNFLLQADLRDSGFICLTGPNGSGKSTLLGVVAGTIRPDSGHVKISEEDVTDRRIEDRGVVLVAQGSFIPHLEVEAHLVWGAKARRRELGKGQLVRVKEALGISFSGRVDELSLGMRERVSLATALLSGPKAILVDEAFANIDDRVRFMENYRSLCRENDIDVLHTTQHKSDALASDHHYDMNAGTAARVF